MAEAATDPLAALMRRDRAVALALLAALCATAVLYLLRWGGMAGMAPGGWGAAHAAAVLAMWWVMMVAMMLPSAAPVVLLAMALNRRATGQGPFAAGAVFVAGYLLAWLGFSLLATAAQWALAAAGLLGPGMGSVSLWLSAALLLFAGAWQFSPLKQACLRHCRSPVGWLTGRARRGAAGALATGLGHGAYCLGCCWALMALLFVGGVMSPWWIVGLALVVLVEKLAPGGARLGRGLGVGLLAAGAAMLALAGRY